MGSPTKPAANAGTHPPTGWCASARHAECLHVAMPWHRLDAAAVTIPTTFLHGARHMGLSTCDFNLGSSNRPLKCRFVSVVDAALKANQGAFWNSHDTL